MKCQLSLKILARKRKKNTAACTANRPTEDSAQVLAEEFGTISLEEEINKMKEEESTRESMSIAEALALANGESMGTGAGIEGSPKKEKKSKKKRKKKKKKKKEGAQQHVGEGEEEDAVAEEAAVAAAAKGGGAGADPIDTLADRGMRGEEHGQGEGGEAGSVASESGNIMFAFNGNIARTASRAGGGDDDAAGMLDAPAVAAAAGGGAGCGLRNAEQQVAAVYDAGV